MQKKDPNKNNNQLGNLIERYKKILKPPQASVEKEAIVVIEKVTNIRLLPHQITYTVSSKTLFVKAPSIIRSELKVYHPTIIKELQAHLGAQNSPHTIL
jgi:hypothetical protein